MENVIVVKEEVLVDQVSSVGLCVQNSNTLPGSR